jgi:hypothetical protein
MFTADSVKPVFFPSDKASLVELNGAGIWNHRGNGIIESVVITLSAPESINRQYFFGGDGLPKGPHQERNLFRTETLAEEACILRNREQWKERATAAEERRESDAP